MVKYFKQNNGLAKIMMVFEGSNTENVDELGCTHFLEHLICKRMNKHQNHMNKNAIIFNAMTGNKYTVFWIEGLDKRIKKFAKIFIKEMSKQKFDVTEEEFKNEKQTILQEYDEVLMDEEEYQLKKFYYKQGLGETIGQRSIIKNFTFNQMKKLYKKHHTKPVYCLIEQSSKWKIKDDIEFKEYYDSPWLVAYDTSKNKPVDMPQPQTPVLICSEEYSSDFGAHYLIKELLTSSLTSPLMKTLREEEQLTYGVYSDQNPLNSFVYYTSFNFIIPTDKVKYAKKKFFETLNSDWMTKKYFKETKKMLKLLLRMQMAQDDEDSSPAMLYLNSNVLEIQKQLANTSYKKVKKIFKQYYSDDRLICLN